MKDAVDSSELTRLDLEDLERKYGFPYMVIHRSDLHRTFLRAAQRLGVDLRTGMAATGYDNVTLPSGLPGARVTFADGSTDQAETVIAADGLHSVARGLLVDDEPVNSAYVAYRGAVPIEKVRENDVSETDVVVYIGPRCHFVQYPLRGGEMFNQVAVFESPKALAGEEDWGTPDELDAAFDGTCTQIQQGLPLMWRDKWWRMFDRDPIMTWVTRPDRAARRRGPSRRCSTWPRARSWRSRTAGCSPSTWPPRARPATSPVPASTGTPRSRRTTRCGPSTAAGC